MATDDVILEQLSAIRSDMTKLAMQMKTLSVEMTVTRHVIQGLAALQDHDHADIADIRARLDRIQARL